MRSALKVGLLLLFIQFTGTAAMASPIKSDEEIIFFPTAARQSADLSQWIVPLHAWVFEPEAESLWRRATLKTLALSLGLDESASESDIFRERARWFLVDNESRKSFRTSLSLEPIGPSGSNGHVEGEIRLDLIAAGELTENFWLNYIAILPSGDVRRFRGLSHCVTNHGLSVISDIDDTIKISQVTDKKALLTNTFLKPFESAPGMAEAYGRLAADDVAFHYVSSSPWQLYPALAGFMADSKFPNGSFHLKDFRLKDQSLFNLFKSSRETKPPIIEGLLAAYPERRFILIGDSGEADPEIYGEIARQHPEQIQHIYIRKVTPEDAEDARYAAAFSGFPRERWTLFEDASIIKP